MAPPTPRAAFAFGLLEWCAGRTGGLGGWSDGHSVDEPTVEFLRSRHLDALHYLRSGEDSVWQHAYDAVLRLQTDALREVVGGLLAAGVRVLTFKGAELIPRYYSERGIGLMLDLDLLVPREQIESARAVLYQLGFRHAVYDRETRTLRDRDVLDVAELERTHYELAPFVRAVALDGDDLVDVAEAVNRPPLYAGPSGPVAVVEVDLHHNVALDAEPEMFFDRACPSTHGLGETFSDADHLWFNLSRYYNEVALHDKLSLRPLAYTLPVIAQGEPDWDVVEHVTAELALGPTLYYMLALCDRLVPGVIPPDTIAAARDSTASRVRDWGWQLGKLFDFWERFPDEAFAPSEQLVVPAEDPRHRVVGEDVEDRLGEQV